MNIQRVEEAVEEAKRFLARAETWLHAERELQAKQLISRGYSHNNPKESGALKRSSMDLTRALVPIREKRS
ncbi:MAG: hypothetical protein E2594_17020 [Pseudomonas sp.]|jgi:hypothetical protein|nr:hypothetical protein [Pseudomonas sp.]